MRRVITFIALLAVSISIPVACFAAGFSIFEAGARALGMGGAFVAQADDPSAIFFNPAGISDLEGTKVYLGVSTIFVGTEFAGVDPDPGFDTYGETGTMVFPPINVYATRQLADGVTAGIGVFNAYGLGQEWDEPDSFVGRHISQNVQLHTYFINPSIAWRPCEWLAVGGGIQAVHAIVALDRGIQKTDPNGSGLLDVGLTELDGDNDIDWGVNVGVLIDPHEDFTLGVSYRSDVTANAVGDADFTQKPTGSPQFDAALAAQFPADQTIETEIKLPWLVSVAGAYHGVEGWVFEIDFNYFGWSEFDVLEFRFDDESLTSARVQDYEDVLSVRTGLSYDLTEKIDLRGGYYWDPTPQPTKAMSPLLADSDRHAVSLGIGYDNNFWVADVFGLWLITSERSTDGESLDGFNGTYSTFGVLCGANVGFNF